MTIMIRSARDSFAIAVKSAMHQIGAIDNENRSDYICLWRLTVEKVEKVESGLIEIVLIVLFLSLKLFRCIRKLNLRSLLSPRVIF